MTPERIAELRKLCEKATAGPWQNDPAPAHYTHGGWAADEYCFSNIGPLRANGNDAEHIIEARQDDAAFITAARTALPEALDEIERLRSELTRSQG